jgi:Ca2+-binding EF-hand superfamily protein
MNQTMNEGKFSPDSPKNASGSNFIDGGLANLLRREFMIADPHFKGRLATADFKKILKRVCDLNHEKQVTNHQMTLIVEAVSVSIVMFKASAW